MRFQAFRLSGVKIYTKTGDKGETSLFGNRRVPKDYLRIETYGTVDELNSLVGVCRSFCKRKKIDRILEEIQNDLFTLGADLATLDTKATSIKRITSSDVTRLEHYIDEIDRHLRPLKRFILPGGDKSAAMMHFARTVCRRAERRAVKLAREENVNDQVVVYLNRLSDLLFVIARRLNASGKTPETTWNPLRKGF